MTADSPRSAGPLASPAPAQQADVSLFADVDRVLFESCLAGDPDAWDSFVERYGGLLALVVDRTAAQRRIAVSQADRDDLLADVLLALLHQDAAVLRGFTGKSSLPTYLTVVARRIVLPGLRRVAARAGSGLHREEAAAGRRVRGSAGAVQPPAPSGSSAQHADPDAADPWARLVRLHDVEGRSFGEISRMTGLPLAAIGPSLKVARQKLGRDAG